MEINSQHEAELHAKNMRDKVNQFNWKDHWKDMPEFVQEKNEPFSKINVRFETEEDLNEFSELIGQKITPKTKSIWHPYKPHRRSGPRKGYVDGP